jgi:error-prone DNA polymerase
MTASSFVLRPSSLAYAELHCKTNFSFLEGASHADELVARAQELGYAALAVTDCESLAGVVRAHAAAKEIGLKLLIGAEIHPVDAPHVVLWATDRKSYGRLSRLITVGRRRAEKGHCQLTFADIAEHAEGLIAGVSSSKFKVQGSKLWESTEEDLAEHSVLSTQYSVLSINPAATRLSLFKPAPTSPTHQHLAAYREIFSGRCYLLAELLRGPDDDAELAHLIQLSQETGLPLVAAGDVHYHTPARQPLWEVLTGTRLGTTVAALAEQRFANAQRHLRPLADIAALYARAPGAISRTLEIAERCTFSLDELRYEYPEELASEGFTPMEYLTYLAWKGARQRYPSGVPAKVRRLIDHELTLIEELRYEAYFLTVWDLVRFARERGILCQGRGSAANSAVCYCLGVTSVNPEQSDVLFERFVSRERNEAPDIDVDFEHERREEVLQYIYDKYGRDRAGMTAVVITYRTKSAVRDVGKALGLSLDRVDALAKNMEGRELDGYFYSDKKTDRHDEAPQDKQVQSPKSKVQSPPPTLDLGPSTLDTPSSVLALRCSEVGIDPASPLGQRLIYLVTELVGFPRHLSQHVGGMVMTQGPLCELAPIENAAMPGRTVIEWDKNDLDDLGILKVDCLSLGMLTAIRKCFDLIHQPGANLLPEKCESTSPATPRDQVWSRLRKQKLTLATVPPEDPRVYDMICRADTIGVFQIESRAQMSMLPRLKPRKFYDLVIEVAIVRPGPIQGNMVHPYLRRRSGEEVPPYPNEAIKEVLHKTLGVPLFQEQAMRLAVVAAGFTPGEADQLRRAMGAWRRPGIIDQFRKKLIEGMQTNGLSEEFALQVFNQIRGFGEYGFPESHATSFALLVYVSAWLKCYHPAAFCAAIINSQPMGFYSPSQLIRDARSHGVQVLPADINASNWDCTLESTKDEGQNTNDDSVRPSSFVLRPSILRLGLRLITGLQKSAANRIEAARAAGPFRSLDDFVHRTGLSQAVVAKLAEADAFSSLALDRRAALWQALGQEKRARSMPLLAGLADDEPPAPLPPMPLVEQVFADYRTSGMSLKAHPIGFFRDQLNQLRVTPAGDLDQMHDGRHLRVAGLVLLRQRPGTAKGITFVTLEDETGLVNLVIRPNIWERYYKIARTSPAWIAHGCLENREGVVHLVANRLQDLSHLLGNLKTHSRDFQ